MWLLLQVVASWEVVWFSDGLEGRGLEEGALPVVPGSVSSDLELTPARA